MHKDLKPAYIVFLFAVILLALIGFLHSNNVALFNSKGLVAQGEQVVLVRAALVMFVVVSATVVTAYFFAWKYRSTNERVNRQESTKTHGIMGELIWWIIPSVVMAFLAYFNWTSAHELDPYKPITVAGVKPLTVQVVALDWKWLFIYPEQHIATVNYLEFPQQTPVNFMLTADGPMNLFWIPQLSGQIMAMPGMSTQLHILANETGEYRGSASDINGQGFAGMKFVAHSVSTSDFDEWVSSVKQSHNSLTLDDYTKLAKPSEYNPVALYSSVQDGLYNRVIDKFMMPPQPSPLPDSQMENRSQSMSGMHM